MKIEFLGTRGKIKPSAPRYENHTGILIDDQLLFDVGEPEFLELPHQLIFFTHYHPDHAFFISAEVPFEVSTPHYGPEVHPMLPDVIIFDSELKWGEYRITSFPVIHARNLRSLGYVVESNGKRVMLTGDVAWIEKGVIDKLPLMDLVCTEATFINKGGRINRKDGKIYGHTGVPDLIRILSRVTNRIAFAHYGEWFFSSYPKGPQMIKELAPPGIDLIPANDGTMVHL